MNLAISNVLTWKTSNILVWRKKEKSVLELMIARTARFCKKSIDQYQFLEAKKALCNSDIYFSVKTAYVKQSQ